MRILLALLFCLITSQASVISEAGTETPAEQTIQTTTATEARAPATETSTPTQTSIETTQSGVDDCSDVNLIKKDNSPFQKIPVLDQSGSGMCYAYVASQLVNFEMIDSGKALSPVVHPAWAAVAYGRVSKDDGIRGGVTSQAIEAVVSQNCDHSIAKEAIGAWARLVNLPENRILAFIDDYGTTLKADLLSGKPDNMTTRKLAFEKAAKANKGDCPLSEWMKLFDNVDQQAKNSMEVADRLMVTQCSSDKLSSLSLPTLKGLTVGNDQDLQQRLDEVLERGKPLSMSFCSNSIDMPWKGYPSKTVAQQTLPNNRREILVDDKSCGPHFALVVGRKKINNSCHYLYRNSRGNKWFSENRHMTCVCKDSQGNVIENCTAQTHPRGYSVEACWVPAAKLLPNVWGVDHY